ncbi:MAG: alpha/beta hydrolase [Synoicihabitans sp.]
MRLIKFALLFAFLFSGHFSSFGQNASTTHTFAEISERKLQLDLYRPSGDIKGVIVWVHGGAWRRGSRANPTLLGMTARGWALASVDYRLSPEAPFPAQSHDIKAAIRFLRAHAESLHIPRDPFVISGASAGGHLAAMVGVTNNSIPHEGTVGAHLDQNSSVQAIVDLYGASNLTTILTQSTPHGLSVREPALDLFIGGHPDNVPELARLASPVFHVDTDDPPLYLSHGDQDPQMPINQAHELHGVYKSQNLPVHFEVKHGSAHGGPAFNDDAELARIDAFLTQHLSK